MTSRCNSQQCKTVSLLLYTQPLAEHNDKRKRERLPKQTIAPAYGTTTNVHIIGFCLYTLPVLHGVQDDPSHDDVVRVEDRDVRDDNADDAAGIPHEHRARLSDAFVSTYTTRASYFYSPCR